MKNLPRKLLRLIAIGVIWLWGTKQLRKNRIIKSKIAVNAALRCNMYLKTKGMWSYKALLFHIKHLQFPNSFQSLQVNLDTNHQVFHYEVLRSLSTHQIQHIKRNTQQGEVTTHNKWLVFWGACSLLEYFNFLLPYTEFFSFCFYCCTPF